MVGQGVNWTSGALRLVPTGLHNGLESASPLSSRWHFPSFHASRISPWNAAMNVMNSSSCLFLTSWGLLGDRAARDCGGRYLTVCKASPQQGEHASCTCAQPVIAGWSAIGDIDIGALSVALKANGSRDWLTCFLDSTLLWMKAPAE